MADIQPYNIVLITLVFVSSLFVMLTEYSLETGVSTPKGYSSNSTLTAAEPSVAKDYFRGHLNKTQTEITKLILDRGYLQPPSTGVPYNLTTRFWVDPSVGQSRVVKNIFNYARNGFFIECGALDGETRSNTLDLERNYGWKGLLIEGDPSNFKLMQTKHRKAWTANCCLSTHPFPYTAVYQQNFNLGRISVNNPNSTNDRTQNVTFVNVQCFPLFSLLSAINVTTVDYFSLDVEGNELEVLQTIPFDLILIKVLSVEFIHIEGGAESLEAFMKSKGYRVVTRIVERKRLAHDLIFVHESVEVTRRFPPKIIVRGSYLYEKVTLLRRLKL